MIPEPDIELWRRVRGLVEWPSTDEDAMRTMGAAWHEAGLAFGLAGTTPIEPGLVDGWTDSAGDTFRDLYRQLRHNQFLDGSAMIRLGYLATEFGNDVEHTKREITRLVNEKTVAFVQYSGFFNIAGADPSAVNILIEEVVRVIREFYGLMETRIRGRGLQQPVDVERPAFQLGETMGPNAGPGPSRAVYGPFYNQDETLLDEELEQAERYGVRPVEARTPEFDRLVASGQPLKWAILEDGRLVFVPKYVDGDVNNEIKHSVLSGGQPVRAAGEARISGSGGNYTGERIDNHSGHYRPSDESLAIARVAFGELGIEFPYAK